VGAGLHGANRLGGNSLSDLLVFGKRAGEHAAAFVQRHGRAAIDDRQVDGAVRAALEPFERDGGENPYTIQNDLQGLMQDKVGIVRIEAEMREALEGIAQLRGRASRSFAPGNRDYNPGWHTALDLDSMLTVSEAIARAGLERKESRGAHFRDDFPEKAASFGKVNIVVQRGSDGQMQVRQVPVVPMSEELKRLVEEFK
jgi:succinate dehydrogenase / fumarate reductase flavoprotein subunit